MRHFDEKHLLMVSLSLSLQGGTVVFHDPKEIVVDGQATKQITLTGTGEVRTISYTYQYSLSPTPSYHSNPPQPTSRLLATFFSPPAHSCHIILALPSLLSFPKLLYSYYTFPAHSPQGVFLSSLTPTPLCIESLQEATFAVVGCPQK